MKYLRCLCICCICSPWRSGPHGGRCSTCLYVTRRVRFPILVFALAAAELHLQLLAFEVFAFQSSIGMKIPFLCLYSGFGVLVLDEAVRVAASLLGLDDDFLDLAKGFKEASQISLQFFL